jgi:putative phosphoribosyl transferase
MSRTIRQEVGLSEGRSGLLTVPSSAQGLVLFAHGSGSGRLSPRNTFVARGLEAGGFATFLFDMLTDEEARGRHNVFDIPLLAERVEAALDHVGMQKSLAHMPCGMFGASTGAAAALVVAARHPSDVAAVVSRGGRPDLAGDALHDVRAPTLLLVGGNDEVVIGLNRAAREQMPGLVELNIVPGAGHLFEEPGALEAVGRATLEWFRSHLRRQ